MENKDISRFSIFIILNQFFTPISIHKCHTPSLRNCSPKDSSPIVCKDSDKRKNTNTRPETFVTRKRFFS